VKTFPDLIREHEIRRDLERKRAADAVAVVKRIHARLVAEGRSNLTAAEERDFQELAKQQQTANEAAQTADSQLEEFQRMYETETENDRLLATRSTDRSGEATKPAYDRVARVGAEARTYRPDQDPNGRQFLRDIAAQHLFNAPDAMERLARHHQEERVERGQYLERAAGTGAFTGLVVPQYLTDLYAPATAALRPFADHCCNVHPLPESGMTVNISRVTTPASVALQASENTAVSETNLDDTLLTENVQTAAGQQTISRQAIERGTGIDDVTMNDLFRRYSSALDSTLINQATTGLSALAQVVTYTDGTPTATEAWPKIMNGVSNVEAALLAQATPTHVVMHSRRWNWFTSRVEAAWPFISVSGMPVNAGGEITSNSYGAVRGRLANGLLVVVDNNIGTTLGAGTEDEIYIVPQQEMHLWEDPNAPVFIRAEQPAAASLGVLFVVYGYFAYSFRRYTNAASKISGTGLIAPTF
jgi:hypothetical protein